VCIYLSAHKSMGPKSHASHLYSHALASHPSFEVTIRWSRVAKSEWASVSSQLVLGNAGTGAYKVAFPLTCVLSQSHVQVICVPMHINHWPFIRD
jgi:hypothetical protein